MGGGSGGGQGLCDRRIEVFGKIKKKWGGGIGGGGLGRGVGLGAGGQGGCERRIKVFVKIQKKKKLGVGGRGRVRWGSGGWGGWVRVDVNAMLGVEGDVGMGYVNQE